MRKIVLVKFKKKNEYQRMIFELSVEKCKAVVIYYSMFYIFVSKIALISVCNKTPITALCNFLKQSFTISKLLDFKKLQALLSKFLKTASKALSLTFSYQRLEKWAVFFMILIIEFFSGFFKRKKNKSVKKLYLTSLLLLLLQSLVGQISHGGKPLSFSYKNTLKSVDIVRLPKYDYNKMTEEDSLVTRNKSNRYGKVHDVNLNPNNSGTWHNLGNGKRIWQLTIKSGGAYSLSLIFDDYQLRNGAQIFVYSADKKHIIGAFNETNNKENLRFSTLPIKGDEIVIELNTSNNKEYGNLNISGVVHDYKGIMGLKTGYGAAAGCNVNINCKEGADWQIEKRAVITMFAAGHFCSGTLINNTAKDAKPYILTAAHCLSTETSAQDGVYSFNYESESCESTPEPIKQSISGAKLIATGGGHLDFTLLELTVTPPDDYNVYYAGWNRAIQLTDTPFVCIHHPQGDIKKISISHDTISIDNYGYGYDFNSHFKISEWHVGTTEGGSSGSALFDKNHLIIGNLTGGDAGCNYNFNDYYARFDLNWDSFPEQDRQLKKWLDPLDLGVEKLQGMYPYELTSGYDAAIFHNSAFKSQYCSDKKIQATFTIKNLGTEVLNKLTIVSKISDKIVYNNVWTGNLASGEETPISFDLPDNLEGELKISTNVSFYNYQIESNLTNNDIEKTITIIKPVDNSEIKGNDKICEGNEIQNYSISSIGAIKWTAEGGEILKKDNQQNVSVKWNKWGEKKLNVNVSNFCNSNDAKINISVIEQHLELTMDIQNNTNACWYITNCNGDTVMSNCDLPAKGKYTASICLSEGCYNLIIDAKGADINNYKLIRDNDNQVIFNDNSGSSSVNKRFALDKVKYADINVYPNPTKTELTIEADFVELYNKNAQFGIFNRNGQTIVEYSKFDSRKVIDISTLTRGTYIVKVKTEFGEIAKKFLKL